VEFGAFVLERALGRGGMGEVFLAHRSDDPDRTRVVLKRLLPDHDQRSDFVKRLVLEAQVAAHLSHPNLIHLIEFGCVGTQHYVTMEYIHGVSLKRVLEVTFGNDAPPPPPVGLRIAAGILLGLSAM